MNIIIQELTERSCHREILAHENDLRIQLQNLSAKQKLMIEKHFYGHKWDIGSASVLRLLSECGMFSIAIYLWKLNDIDEEQNILNDLLETEYHLIADVVEKSILEAPIGNKLKSILEIGLSNLLQDLVKNSTINVPNYIQILRKHHLNVRQMEYFRNMHFRAIVNIEPSESVLVALSKQLEWNSEQLLESNQSLLDIIAEICWDMTDTLQKLLEMMATPTFKGWKFGLILIKFILWTVDSGSIIKKIIGESFGQWIKHRNDFHFRLMMLLGRQMAYAAGAQKNDVFYQWYKFQIADMNYVLKSKEEFQYAIKVLHDLIPNECDPEFLQIQANTSIPAPPYCKAIVNNYKQACKFREQQLRPQLPLLNDDLVIVID